MELQRASITLDIQSIKLAVSGQSAFTVKKLLSDALPADYQLFVQRDGFLIRYSSDVEEFVGLEPTIREIRLLNKVELAKGTFFLVEQKKDKFWVTKVEAWIPHNTQVLETAGSLEKVIKDHLFFTDLNSDYLKQLGFKENQYSQFPELTLNKEHVLKSTIKQAKLIKATLGGTAAFVLLSAILTWWGTEDKEKLNPINISKKVESVLEDPFEEFRAYQSKKTTVGRALYGAEAVFHTFKAASLPSNWESTPITITPTAIHSALIPKGTRIGRISDIEYTFKNHPNLKFLTMDGQQVEMNVPLDHDGAGYGNKYVPIDDVRGPILDILSDMKATRIQSMMVHKHNNYTTQRVIVDFTNVSPLHLGVLSRVFANKPIYIEKGTITEQDGNVSINLEFIFTSINKA